MFQQSTALEPANHQFQTTEKSIPQISGNCLSRFHPTEPVLACGSTGSSSVILLKGANGSIPFANWKIEQEFKRQTQEEIYLLEWNVNGTQLAAGCADGTVIVWSYPSGDVLFEEKKHSDKVKLITWNPFRQDVFATSVYGKGKEQELLIWNTRENGNAKKAKHFLTLQHGVRNFTWISAKLIAIGKWNGEIEIFEIDEDAVRSWGTYFRLPSPVKNEVRNKERTMGQKGLWITGLAWNEKIKYLAAGSRAGWIKIWSMENDLPVYSLQVDSSCWHLAWRRNVKPTNNGGLDAARKDKENLTIACGLEDQSIVIWNPLEEDEAKRNRILPQKHSDWIWSMSFSPDGRFFASVDWKNELFVWSTENWLPVFTCQNDVSDLSWMSTDSSSVPTNKLAARSMNKVLVVEQFSME